MRYRNLGNSGCAVSELCLGTMTFGAETDERGSHAQLDRFVEAGGTLVDTADVYSAGVSEEFIGRWLADRPADVTDRVVLATKGRFAMGTGPNDLGLSTRHLTRALDASLRRLGVDSPDPETLVAPAAPAAAPGTLPSPRSRAPVTYAVAATTAIVRTTNALTLMSLAPSSRVRPTGRTRR